MGDTHSPTMDYNVFDGSPGTREEVYGREKAMAAIAFSVSPGVVARHAKNRDRRRARPPAVVLAPPGVGGVERYRIETGQVPPEEVPSPALQQRSVLGAVVKRLVAPHTPGRHGPACKHGSTWLGGRCWRCPSDSEWEARTAGQSQQPPPPPPPPPLPPQQQQQPQPQQPEQPEQPEQRPAATTFELELREPEVREKEPPARVSTPVIGGSTCAHQMANANDSGSVRVQREFSARSTTRVPAVQCEL
jgi:hypothetical protein